MEESPYKSPHTGCVCPMAGYCSRHHINKNAHFHKLCQTRQDYFEMYEACAGPGQEFTSCDGSDPEPMIPTITPETECPSCKKQEENKIQPENKKPSLWDMAKSFTKASVEHVKSGMQHVSDEIHQERMNTCLACEHYNPRGTCNKCGCYLPVKTKWLANSCPVGKWRE